jgi:hypothetical protein
MNAISNPLDDDDDIAELESARAHIARGESIFREANAECEIQKRLAELRRWNKAISAEANHPRMSRARAIVTRLECALEAWRLEYLRSWCGYTKPN